MVSQARRSNRRMHSASQKPIKHGLREIVLIFFCFVGLYLFVSLLTYYGGDPGISHSSPVEEIRNKGGIVGALFADLFFNLFGYFAYLFPIMVGYMGWLIYQGRHHDLLAEPRSLVIPGIGFILTLSAGCGLAIVHFMAESALLPTHAGGILGLWVGNGLVAIVDRLGATLILLAVFFTGVTLLTGLSWLKLMDTLGYYTLNHWYPIAKKYLNRQFLPWIIPHAKEGLKVANSSSKRAAQKVGEWTQTIYTRWKDRRTEWRKEREKYYDDNYDYDDDYDDDDFIQEKTTSSNSKRNDVVRPQSKKPQASPSVAPILTLSSPTVEITPPIPPLLPALSLLKSVPNITTPMVQMLPQQIIDAFASLNVEIGVNAVHQGPVLTSFEVQMITPISTDHLDELGKVLAKYLNVPNVQVVETQPGILGIEMPNFKRQTIYLIELLGSSEYQDNPSPLAVALGEDVSGQPVVVDLSRIPHILMAGRSASERSIAINILILSLLYQSTPDMVRFLLIDNTGQELLAYADLPHLLTPVITDMAQTPQALQWCAQEMERRYRLMAQMGVRNIEDYNQALLLQDNDSENAVPRALFYIVVVINEIVDLMTINVEQAITRLTQKSRAAGIHIILATQHPTVNVITGLVKANIPTRMAFQVNNQSESRIILGQIGAEMLLGKGDMLYMTAGTGKPVRVHGTFVSNQEVRNVVADLKSRAAPNYIEFKLDEG